MRQHDIPLDVVVKTRLGSTDKVAIWDGVISGVDTPDHISRRPAVFIQDPEHTNTVTGKGFSMAESLQSAVKALRGRQVRVILRERDEILTFPDDLTW